MRLSKVGRGEREAPRHDLKGRPRLVHNENTSPVKLVSSIRPECVPFDEELSEIHPSMDQPEVPRYSKRNEDSINLEESPPKKMLGQFIKQAYSNPVTNRRGLDQESLNFLDALDQIDSRTPLPSNPDKANCRVSPKLYKVRPPSPSESPCHIKSKSTFIKPATQKITLFDERESPTKQLSAQTLQHSNSKLQLLSTQSTSIFKNTIGPPVSPVMSNGMSSPPPEVSTDFVQKPKKALRDFLMKPQLPHHDKEPVPGLYYLVSPTTDKLSRLGNDLDLKPFNTSQNISRMRPSDIKEKSREKSVEKIVKQDLREMEADLSTIFPRPMTPKTRILFQRNFVYTKKSLHDFKFQQSMDTDIMRYKLKLKMN